MGLTNLIKKRTVWFMLVAVFVATGFLRAQDSAPLSKEELKTLIVSAKTAEDHERLAKHFDAEADQLEAQAKDHQEMAQQYKANPTIQEMKHPMSGQTAAHCVYFADALNKAAKQARALAADHRQMATESHK